MIEKPYHKKRKWLVTLGMIVALLIPAVLLTFKITSEQTLKCNVCMTYMGRQMCKDASAATQDECTRTGVDNACALISSGMTGSIACGNTEPTSVKFY